jgi:hypothetical protein
MLWSKQPEMTLKKDDKAPFPGVLVPELNYKNYKTFEITSPQILKIIEGNAVPVHYEESASVLASPVLWGIIGVCFGYTAAKIMKP